jgi:hypothetical protein
VSGNSPRREGEGGNGREEMVMGWLEGRGVFVDEDDRETFHNTGVGVRIYLVGLCYTCAFWPCVHSVPLISQHSRRHVLALDAMPSFPLTL